MSNLLLISVYLSLARLLRHLVAPLAKYF